MPGGFRPTCVCMRGQHIALGLTHTRAGAPIAFRWGALMPVSTLATSDDNQTLRNKGFYTSHPLGLPIMTKNESVAIDAMTSILDVYLRDVSHPNVFLIPSY